MRGEGGGGEKKKNKHAGTGKKKKREEGGEDKTRQKKSSSTAQSLVRPEEKGEERNRNKKEKERKGNIHWNRDANLPQHIRAPETETETEKCIHSSSRGMPQKSIFPAQSCHTQTPPAQKKPDKPSNEKTTHIHDAVPKRTHSTTCRYSHCWQTEVKSRRAVMTAERWREAPSACTSLCARKTVDCLDAGSPRALST